MQARRFPGGSGGVQTPQSRSRDIGIRAQKPPKKFSVKEVPFKKHRKKYFTRLYVSRYPFIPNSPLLDAMSFLPFSSKIKYAHFLNRITPKKKLHQMCDCDVQTLQTKSTMYKQCKQISRDFAKKSSCY